MQPEGPKQRSASTAAVLLLSQDLELQIGAGFYLIGMDDQPLKVLFTFFLSFVFLSISLSITYLLYQYPLFKTSIAVTYCLTILWQ